MSPPPTAAPPGADELVRIISSLRTLRESPTYKPNPIIEDFWALAVAYVDVRRRLDAFLATVTPATVAAATVGLAGAANDETGEPT